MKNSANDLETATAPKSVPPPSLPSTNKRAGVLAAVSLGLLSSTFVSFGARISIAEIILVGYLFLQIANTKTIPKVVISYISCLTILLLGFIAANATHGLGVDSLLREIGGIGIFLLSIISMAQFLRIDFNSRLASVLLGSALGEVLGFYVTPTPEILIDPWKFGLGNAVTVIAILAVSHRLAISTSTWMMPVILVSLATLHFAMGSRSLAGILVLAVVLVALKRHTSSHTKLKSIGLFVIIGLIVIGVLNLYSKSAEAGLLGEDSATKFNDQNGELGILPGARKEILLLAAAWIKSPIFGWGPTAAVDNEHLGEVYNWYITNGYTINHADFNRLFNVDSLPLHSITLGLLVQAGLFALPLIALLLQSWVRALSFGIASKNLLVTFIALSGGVHLLMSPLGDTTRFPVALALAIGLLVSSRLKQGNSRKIRQANQAAPGYGAV